MPAGVGGRWAILLGSAMHLGACEGDPGGPDWLLATATDPADGRVARLWCTDLCDVPGRVMLTLSPVDRQVVTTPATEGFPPTADLPAQDQVLTFDAGGVEGAPVALHWTGANEVTIAAPCPVARDAAKGGVTVRLRATDCQPRP